MTANRVAAFPAVYALLRVAADVADHWVQSDHQAQHKAKPGAEGHKALAGHVASYTATQAAALLVGNRVLGLGLRPRSMAAALALSASTHYLIDRRWPVRKAAEATGKARPRRLDRVATRGAPPPAPGVDAPGRDPVGRGHLRRAVRDQPARRLPGHGRRGTALPRP